MSQNAFDRTVLGYEGAKLLEALLGHVNEAGRAQVSTSELLSGSGLTQGAFIRGRTELSQHGLLRTEPGFSPNGLRGANVYVLNMTALESDEPDQNGTAVPSGAASPAETSDSVPSGRGRASRKGVRSWLPWRSRSS